MGATSGQRQYDWASVAILLLFFVLLLRIRSHLPVFSDSWYHLSVIRGFSERGISLWAWWEFAPFGRPQLYSPLFHVLNLAALRLTHVALLDLARLYDVVTFPVILAAGWWAARCLFGKRAALLTLLLLSLNIGLLFPCSLIMMPGTFALLLLPFVHILVLRRTCPESIRDWLGAGLLLAIVGYLHLGVFSMAVISLLILPALKKEYRRPCLSGIVLAVVLFGPWLVHLYRHREFLHSGVARLPVFIPLFALLGLTLGLLATIRHPIKESLSVLSMILASCLFLFTLRERFWTYGGFLFAILGGYGIEQCAGRRLRLVLVMLAASCASITPFLRPLHMKLALPVPFRATPGIIATPFLTLAEWQKPGMAVEIPEAVPKDLGELARWISENVNEDEVLLTNDRFLGGSLFVLTGRRTSSGLWSEVMTSELEEKLAQNYQTSSGHIIINRDASDATRLQGKVSVVATFGKYMVLGRSP